MLEIRGKHGFTPKYMDVQAPTAAMNIHRHSRCHYKRNSGSTPAGMNNLHIGGPAGRQTPGGSPVASAAAATTTSISDGKTAAAMAPGRTLPLEGSRSCPLAGDKNQPLKPKSRRPGVHVTLTVSSAEKPSPATTTSAPTTAATCLPTPRPRAATAPEHAERGMTLGASDTWPRLGLHSRGTLGHFRDQQERFCNGIPPEGGIEPSNPIERGQVLQITCRYFWSAPLGH
jgi:hypothetical protein